VDSDGGSLADVCMSIARDQGLELTDAQLAQVTKMLARSRRALLQMRQIELVYGPFYQEPATALKWLEDQGTRRNAD